MALAARAATFTIVLFACLLSAGPARAEIVAGENDPVLLPVQVTQGVPQSPRQTDNGRVPNATGYDQLKTAAQSGEDQPGSDAPDVGPTTQVFNGLNRAGLGPNGLSPPDTTGAVSRSHYVELVNSQIAVYNKATLDQLSQATLATFLGAPNDFVFDPQVLWDEATQRFYYVAIRRVEDTAGTETHYTAFGWSKTSDPTLLNSAGWCQFYLRTGVAFDDYPKLGDSDTHIVIGANVFDSNFNSARIRAIGKPPNGDLTCTTPPSKQYGTQSNPLMAGDGGQAFTPVPANGFSSSTTGWVVAAEHPSFFDPTNQATVWAVTGPASAPVLDRRGKIDINGYSTPPNAKQTGNSFRLDTLDTRFTQAVAAHSPQAGATTIWTQHTVKDGTSGNSAVRWHELRPGNLTRRQGGQIRKMRAYVFNGAISPGANGGAAVVHYNVSNASIHPQVRARSRKSGTQLNEFGPEFTVATAAFVDQDYTCGSSDGRPGCRWGDYAGASPDPDPANPTVVWGSNQHNGPPVGDDAAWRTRNFALRPTP